MVFIRYSPLDNRLDECVHDAIGCTEMYNRLQNTHRSADNSLCLFQEHDVITASESDSPAAASRQTTRRQDISRRRPKWIY